MSTISIKHMKLHNDQVKMNSKTLMSSASDAKIQTKRKPKISLIIGGIQSGKSSYALEYTMGFGNTADQRAIVATSTNQVNEIKDICVTNGKDPNNSFLILKERNYVPQIIEKIPNSVQIIVIDNISSWIANLITDKKDSTLLENELVALIKKSNRDIILISNIVGLGIISVNESDKLFRDQSGFFNQRLAKIADNVILMVAGIPMKIKGDLL